MIRSVTDPERFRTTYYGARRYVDPLPADDRWQPTGEKERLPNCTSIAKEIGSQQFFKRVGETKVPLDALRVADYALANWERLTGTPEDERRVMLASSAAADLARAADRGTAVHALIEALLRGETPMILEPEVEPYREVAEAVAAEFAGIVDLVEVVAFRRTGEVHFGGTFDAMAGDGSVLLDWKTRGPDSKHGCYEKEVAQLGLGQLCDYHIAPASTGAQRVPMPEFAECLVVSIRPDGFEVFPVDTAAAIDAAEAALEVFAARKRGAASARSATGAPRHTAIKSSTGTLPPPGVEPPPEPPLGRATAPGESIDHPLVAWVTARYDELLACGVEPAAVARRWPEGLPPPRKAADMHLDQLIAAADLLERLGDERGQPFGEPRPDRPQPQLRHVAEADIRPPLRPAPDEGPEIGAAEADMVRAEFAALDDTIRHDVARWAMEAGRAGRTWTMQRNGKPVTLRRRQTSGAALSLARLADGDDAVARAALAVVIGEDECQTHPVGALLGTLTIEEAGKLTQVAEGCTLTLADDGAPVIGVAS